MNDLIFNTSYVNGGWASPVEPSFVVSNPADGSAIVSVSDGGIEATHRAIEAADAAFVFWKKQTAQSRALLLEKWYAQIMNHKIHLAQLMTTECGKPLRESLGEVDYGASFIKWFAEEGKRIYGDIIPATSEDKRIMVIKQAIGVVGVITPWNFPLAMITRKVGAALAAGCTVVVRPSEETPLAALALAHLAEKAGFPPGVFNVVVGKDAAQMGKVLCESEAVRKISFTGSTRVGQILMRQCVDTVKKLSLELGGNAPFIVFEDADIDAAVQGAVASKFRNAGQTCVCVNRFLIHEKVYDAFVEKFVSAVAALKVGNGLKEGVSIGPVINQKAVKKSGHFVEDALKKGGRILLGGKALDEHFFEPTIIGEATLDMEFAQEEIFGPIAPLFRFSSDEEAIKMANDTRYGLAAYFYSQNVSRCWKVGEALDYGMIGINEGIISTEVAPFGGVKHSGQGREGSKYGIEDYLEIKYLCYGNIH